MKSVQVASFSISIMVVVALATAVYRALDKSEEGGASALLGAPQAIADVVPNRQQDLLNDPKGLQALATRPSIVSAPAAGSPKLILEEERFDFGVLELGQSGAHRFRLRNEGNADLELQLDKATCGCVRAELSASRVSPGKEAFVHLNWTPPKPAALFSQGVLVRSNDPQRPAFHLMAIGKVQAFWQIVPESLEFADLDSRGGSRSVGIYSEAWNSVDVLEINSSAKWLQAHVVSLPSEELPEGANCGTRLEVSVQPGLSQGTHEARLSVRLRGRTSSAANDRRAESTRDVEIPVLARVVGPYSLQGARVDESGRWQLGVLPFGNGCKQAAVMTFHSAGGVRIEHVSVHPPSLIVTHREMVDNRAPSRIVLRLEIPMDFPPGDFRKENSGWIKLRTSVADLREIVVPVEFIVAPRN